MRFGRTQNLCQQELIACRGREHKTYAGGQTRGADCGDAAPDVRN